MQQVQVKIKGQDGGGYSAVKRYDKNGIYISLGGGTSIGSGPVVLINDKFISILIRNNVAEDLCARYIEARSDEDKTEAWAKLCVKKMYEYAYKDPTILRRVAEESYRNGYNDGDSDRTHAVHKALRLV